MAHLARRGHFGNATTGIEMAEQYRYRYGSVMPQIRDRLFHIKRQSLICHRKCTELCAVQFLYIGGVDV